MGLHVLAACLPVAVVAFTGCTVKNEATDKICQPKQKSHCNDCPKTDPSDSRVYVGWNTCADDGKSCVGSCTECAPEHPMAASPKDGPFASGGEALGLDLPDRACAWSSGANDWEQCHDGHWYLGVFSDDSGTFGPAGTCSEIHDSP